MIATQNISLSYSGKPLFKNVNIKFTAGNCYGIIGANGAGKSTFLKVLSGELEPTTGEVVHHRPANAWPCCSQDHNALRQPTTCMRHGHHGPPAPL